MTVEEIKVRIKEWETKLARDASYNIPANRVAGELSLALWVIALELAEMNESRIVGTKGDL